MWGLHPVWMFLRKNLKHFSLAVRVFVFFFYISSCFKLILWTFFPCLFFHEITIIYIIISLNFGLFCFLIYLSVIWTTLHSVSDIRRRWTTNLPFLCVLHWGNGHLCELHQGFAILSELDPFSLTFALIRASRQSNAVINQDHKEVMAFIPLSLRYKKGGLLTLDSFAFCLMDLFQILT